MKIKASFAGIEFSGNDMGDGRVSMRTTTLRKILETGLVKCYCTGNFSDDYVEDAKNNFDRGITDVNKIHEELNELKQLKETPTLLYLDTNTKQIRFKPDRSVGYEIK